MEKKSASSGISLDELKQDYATGSKLWQEGNWREAEKHFRPISKHLGREDMQIAISIVNSYGVYGTASDSDIDIVEAILAARKMNSIDLYNKLQRSPPQWKTDKEIDSELVDNVIKLFRKNLPQGSDLNMNHSNLLALSALVSVFMENYKWKEEEAPAKLTYAALLADKIIRHNLEVLEKDLKAKGMDTSFFRFRKIVYNFMPPAQTSVLTARFVNSAGGEAALGGMFNYQLNPLDFNDAGVANILDVNILDLNTLISEGIFVEDSKLGLALLTHEGVHSILQNSGNPIDNSIVKGKLIELSEISNPKGILGQRENVFQYVVNVLDELTTAKVAVGITDLEETKEFYLYLIDEYSKYIKKEYLEKGLDLGDICQENNLPAFVEYIAYLDTVALQLDLSRPENWNNLVGLIKTEDENYYNSLVSYYSKFWNQLKVTKKLKIDFFKILSNVNAGYSAWKTISNSEVFMREFQRTQQDKTNQRLLEKDEKKAEKKSKPVSMPLPPKKTKQKKETPVDDPKDIEETIKKNSLAKKIGDIESIHVRSKDFSSKQGIMRYIEKPWQKAAEILYDKNINTLFSSANKNDATKPFLSGRWERYRIYYDFEHTDTSSITDSDIEEIAFKEIVLKPYPHMEKVRLAIIKIISQLERRFYAYLDIDYPSLSKENKKIARNFIDKKITFEDVEFMAVEGRVFILVPVTPDTLVAEIERKTAAIANFFQEQRRLPVVFTKGIREKASSAIKEREGGIDMRTDGLNLDIRGQSSSSSLSINNVPFNIQNFQGFTFQILRLKRNQGPESILGPSPEKELSRLP